MGQNYQNISVTEKVSDSLSKLLERDETAATMSAGSSEPQTLSPQMIGRMFLNTTSKQLKYVSKYENGAYTWTLIIDFSQPLATQSQVSSGYQPKHNNLTALSNVTATANTIPYFNSSKTMATLATSSFFRSWVNTNASGARTLLGLGPLATVASITSSNINSIIPDRTLPVSKFNFTPISAGEGYTVGDIKESYDKDITWSNVRSTGFLLLNTINYNTIGDSTSGAAHAGDAYQNLYYKLWGQDAVVQYYNKGSDTATTKGSSASADWNAHKRISLPKGTNYINANCKFLIRYL